MSVVASAPLDFCSTRLCCCLAMSESAGSASIAKAAEVKKNIKEGFALFDRDGKGICDVREIGTIVRHLGICPTEIELRDLITECEEEEPTGFIRFERFERMMSRVLLENQYPRDSEEKLLRAFRVRRRRLPLLRLAAAVAAVAPSHRARDAHPRVVARPPRRRSTPRTRGTLRRRRCGRC